MISLVEIDGTEFHSSPLRLRLCVQGATYSLRRSPNASQWP